MQTDRDVLCHLYRTTGGDSWSRQDGWAQNDADLSTWFGVTTNADGRVIMLELDEQGVAMTRGNNLCGERLIRFVPWVEFLYLDTEAGFIALKQPSRTLEIQV